MVFVLGGQSVMHTKYGAMLASVLCSAPVCVASIAPCYCMLLHMVYTQFDTLPPSLSCTLDEITSI